MIGRVPHNARTREVSSVGITCIHYTYATVLPLLCSTTFIWKRASPGVLTRVARCRIYIYIHVRVNGISRVLLQCLRF